MLNNLQNKITYYSFGRLKPKIFFCCKKINKQKHERRYCCEQHCRGQRDWHRRGRRACLEKRRGATPPEKIHSQAARFFKQEINEEDDDAQKAQEKGGRSPGGDRDRRGDEEGVALPPGFYSMGKLRFPCCRSRLTTTSSRAGRIWAKKRATYRFRRK